MTSENYSMVAAMAVLSATIWIASAPGNAGIAADHYRIGTLNLSHHYRDDEDYNHRHDGIYLVHNNNVIGTYLNSQDSQSFFYARNNPINRTFSYSYGLSIGYDSGMMPMVGLSALFGVVKLTFTQEAAVVGFEIEL